MEGLPALDKMGRIVLPGRSMGRVVLVLLLVFVGLLVMVERGASGALWMLGAAALTLVFFSIQLVPGANRLELTREGFTCVLVFCRYPTLWKDVEQVAVDELGNVVWNYAPHVVHASRKARSVRIARKNTGFDACLPDTYGLNAPMLAGLMNRLREESVNEGIC